jgi:hypothetical protein
VRWSAMAPEIINIYANLCTAFSMISRSCHPASDPSWHFGQGLHDTFISPSSTETVITGREDEGRSSGQGNRTWDPAWFLPMVFALKGLATQHRALFTANLF